MGGWGAGAGGGGQGAWGKLEDGRGEDGGVLMNVFFFLSPFLYVCFGRDKGVWCFVFFSREFAGLWLWVCGFIGASGYQLLRI